MRKERERNGKEKREALSLISLHLPASLPSPGPLHHLYPLLVMFFPANLFA